MDFDNTTYVLIDEFVFCDFCNLYRKYFDEKCFAVDAELGLRFLSYISKGNDRFDYRFKIIDKQKWFLSKIKYGL